MSLRDRAQQHSQARGRSGGPATLERNESQQAGGTPQLFAQARVGIVDGNIVEVVGITDIPGMSLAWICTDPETGYNGPVPYTDARVFTSLTKQAVQALLEAERRNT